MQLVLVDVGEPLVEQKGQDIVLVFGGIQRAAAEATAS
jgi:hypothetical protein